MVAVDRDRAEARPAPNLNASLLTVSAIYGPNASGKSNIIAALGWLQFAVLDSLRFWEDGIPLEPFAFTDDPDRPAEFTIESVVGGVRFEYVLELNRDRVHYEGLFHYPERKRRRIFEREGNELTLQRGLGQLSGARELLTSTTLALSAARRFNEPHVSGFTRDLLNTQVLGAPVTSSHWRRRRPRFAQTRHWFEDPVDDGQTPLPGFGDLLSPTQEDRTRALALLRIADLGIDDVLIDDEPIDLQGVERDSPPPRMRRRVRLVHRSGHERLPLDFSAESEGTRTWFALIAPVLTALKNGSRVLFDELDASLHPTLSAQLIRLFQDPVTNPEGAQLIFTSHDTSLLGQLNRDEVWLTEKLDDGSTRLGALAEFAGERVRKSQNLEKAYLHGRFGALPDVDRTEMLRALGLIG
ncbi:ATP-binding protein [Actinophytocola sp. S1-96]|uniref:ATP-binding protein n=2 Tax=Actinophytocola gossypii TaxID=2812003 RepID=A0ABT2J6G2_9PSEU|nr:ATP-binding protein [Actinophytocola gossypii]